MKKVEDQELLIEFDFNERYGEKYEYISVFTRELLLRNIALANELEDFGRLEYYTQKLNEL